MSHPLARGCWLFFVALFPCALAGCSSDGHFTLLGYTTRPNYDCEIRTVYVPIFGNVTFRRGLEFDLTRAVIREIEAKTPYKVVDNRLNADTELIGKIVTWRKNLVTYNPLGEVRDAEAGLGIEITWRDLRPGNTGAILSSNRRKEELRGEVLAPGALPPPPAIITPAANFIPELGGSLTSAEKLAVDRAAVQIISQMEVWR